jgi:hypothetical protein
LRPSVRLVFTHRGRGVGERIVAAMIDHGPGRISAGWSQPAMRIGYLRRAEASAPAALAS